MDYLRLSWNDIESGCKRLSLEIESRGISSYILVGVSRGGLVPLRLISDYISASQIHTMGVRFYEDIGRTGAEPVVFSPVPVDMGGKNIILVEDISDTGKSLLAAKKHLKESGANIIVVATLVKKPHTLLMPDIFDIETSSWVIFPWEVHETIGLIIRSATNRSEAEKELSRAGFEKREYLKALDLEFGGVGT